MRGFSVSKNPKRYIKSDTLIGSENSQTLKIVRLWWGCRNRGGGFMES